MWEYWERILKEVCSRSKSLKWRIELKQNVHKPNWSLHRCLVPIPTWLFVLPTIRFATRNNLIKALL